MSTTGDRNTLAERPQIRRPGFHRSRRDPAFYRIGGPRNSPGESFTIGVDVEPFVTKISRTGLFGRIEGCQVAPVFEGPSDE